MTKQEKDKLAEKGILYQKYYESMKLYLRYNSNDFNDIKISFEKANQVYHRKISQLNAIIFILDLLFSSNEYYSPQARELFGWSIQLIESRIKYYLEQQLKELTKE